MVDKEDFDFIKEEEIEKAMKNIIGDKGLTVDRTKIKKKNYEEDKQQIDENDKSAKISTKKNEKLQTSHTKEKNTLNLKDFFEKEAKDIVNDKNLTTQEKIEILNKNLNKKYVKLLDRFQRLSPEEMKIKEEVMSTFIDSERDILILESAIKVKPDIVYNDFLTYSKEIDKIFKKDYILNENDIVLVKKFSTEIVKKVSPNQNESLRILSLTDYVEEDISYLASHSLNTAILSIITAIELSKLMKERIEFDKEYSLYETQSYSQKIFNENELVELGISALLHDISLKNEIGEIKRNDQYTTKIDDLKYQAHPRDSYYIVTKLKISQESANAIHNHHENIIGTGFPKQINQRFLDKYSRILAFVSRYEEMAYGSPYEKHYGPSLAMNYLMKNERTLWDGDVILSFLKSTSPYPVGSYVELDNGDIGIVHSVNKGQIKRPIIKILLDSQNNVFKEDKFIDLSEESNINVKKVIHPFHIRRMFKRYENHYGLEEGFFERMGSTLKKS